SVAVTATDKRAPARRPRRMVEVYPLDGALSRTKRRFRVAYVPPGRDSSGWATLGARRRGTFLSPSLLPPLAATTQPGVARLEPHALPVRLFLRRGGRPPVSRQ